MRTASERRQLVAALSFSGAAALLFLAAVSTSAPAVELDSTSAAGFAQAAHAARSWAAKAFASPPPPQAAVQARVAAAAAVEAKQHEARSEATRSSRQQVLAAVKATGASTRPKTAQQQQQQLAPTQEPAVSVHEQQQQQPPRFNSPSGARPLSPHRALARQGFSFFSDAVSELGRAPSSADLKKASAHADLSFDAAAKSELSPAPRMSVLRSSMSAPHTTSQQQLASMTVTPHGKAPQGYAGRQFSLARESRESAGNAAYDFG